MKECEKLKILHQELISSKKYLKPNNIKLSEGFMFKYIVVENGSERAFLEALSIGLLCPAHIGIGEKT